MEAAIFNCQCDQMQNCEGGCETTYCFQCRSEEFINLCTKYDISYNSGPVSRSRAIWQYFSMNIKI